MADATDHQRLGQRQLHNGEQNENEQHRKRAGDAGQRYFQARGHHRQRQVTDRSGTDPGIASGPARVTVIMAPITTIGRNVDLGKCDILFLLINTGMRDHG